MHINSLLWQRRTLLYEYEQCAWITVTPVYHTMEIVSSLHTGLQRKQSLVGERQVTVPVCRTYISYSYWTCWRDVGKMNTDFGNRQEEVRVKQRSARKYYVRCSVE